MIFGAGHDAVPLVRLAQELGWYVTVVDNRKVETTRERFPSADEVILSRPEGINESVSLDNCTMAVVMTHNYLHDLEILKTLLFSPVRYLGILGPKSRTEKLLQDLQRTRNYPNEKTTATLCTVPLDLTLVRIRPKKLLYPLWLKFKLFLLISQEGYSETN
jgi:xanthine/CO dehydrogenase XdhC/CoxF family maturation factor